MCICNVWMCIVDNHDIISLKLYDINTDRKVSHPLHDQCEFSYNFLVNSFVIVMVFLKVMVLVIVN